MRAPRLLQRLLSRRRRVPLFYTPSYDFALPATPMDASRGAKILGALDSAGLVRRASVREPREASLHELLQVHGADYLESLARPESLLRIIGITPTEHQHERALAVQRRMTGGTVEAARAALAAGAVAVNLGGGFHHAHRDQGQGFCIFNDIAVAVCCLRREGFAGRVLVVDLDLHDGDGTRALFADDPEVHTFSIHNAHWGPPEAVASTSIELGGEVADEEYLTALAQHLPPVFEQHRPELVCYLAGTDPAADDALGDWRITAEGMLRRDRDVLELCRQGPRPVPLVVVLAGGYGEEAWRYSARFFSLLLAGRLVEPPPTEEVLLRRFQAVARLLPPAQLRGDPGGVEEWGLTEEDLTGALRGVEDQRLLGYYSRHGVELALERAGVLERLRDQGFSRPRVELDLEHPAGHTLRLWGGGGRGELLAEVRLRRDRHTIPEMELLAAEWLLLQNPRIRFPAGRTPLPGQQHPGLGMLRETIALFIMVCERLHLDGILFTPAHYHLATQGQRYLRFFHSRDAGRFRALQRAVSGLPLADATRLVDSGGVVDAATGEPIRWPAMPMVLPVSERLRQVFDEESYEEAAAAAERELHYIRR